MSNKEIKSIKENFIYIKNNLNLYISSIDKIYTDFLNFKVDSNTVWDDFSKNSIKYYNVIEELCPGVLGNNDTKYGLSEEMAREIEDQCFFPDGLLCTLRKYQEWGVKYILHQEKVLLGDEMGLGKTIQAIATMVSLKNTGATHFIVVCPASVITNWCREISKHSKLRVTKIHGNGEKIKAFKSWLKTGGVAVTNYESTQYIKFNKDFKFSLLVVDEAHYIKNEDARRSRNTYEIANHAERLLFMTGTALENKVDEMITLIKHLRPDISNDVKGLAFMSSAPQFRNKIAPVYYRRKREDVLTELPDKVESNEWCTLNHDEEIIYENAVLSRKYQDIRRVSWNIDDLNKSSKAMRLKEIVNEAEQEGRKVLVFSFFLNTISKIHEFLGDRCLNPINGSVNIKRRQEIIDEFDSSPAGTVLLAQINSGGTGLNIQSASVVVICEPQFKPSLENQAISRSYRMGQTRNVLVYRLLCENTVDEKIEKILESKQDIFNAFADKSAAAELNVSIDESTFGEIIKDEIERIKKKNNIAVDLGNNSSDGLSFESINFNNSAKNKLDNAIENREYYDLIMKMSYKELVEHLLKKYGPAKYDYFTNENCTYKNKKVTRTSEGLYCHHIDEDKAIMLSNDKRASKNPFTYQKADRLVYCNILEHFLLHILIYEEPKSVNANKDEIQGIGGAVTFICRQLNDYYGGYEYKMAWIINVMSKVKDNYDSYIAMLNRLWKDIKNDKKVFIVKKELAMGWNDNVYSKILNEIE